MTTIRSKEFIKLVAKESNFSQNDIQIILNAIISVFMNCVRDDIEVKLYSFGKLYQIKIPARKVKSYTNKDGTFHEDKDLPETKKVLFALSDTIKKA